MLKEREALLEKYPDIYFFLSYTDYSAYEMTSSADGKVNAVRKKGKTEEFLHSISDIDEEVKLWAASLDLDDIEILYVYGVGLGYCYAEIKNWLHKLPQRRVVFLEDDLGAIAAFFQAEAAAEITEDPQVVLRFVRSWKADLDNLAQTFPCAHVAVTALPAYAKKSRAKISRIRLQLLRSSSSFHALFSEALFSHKLLQNLAPNLKRLPSAFYANELEGRYQGVPAIICGAGPSLKSVIGTLKTLENRALIIAGGSAIAALSNQGVVPHLAMALDPNPEEYERLKASAAFEVPLLFGSRLQPDVFSTCNGPIGYLKSDTGGLFESWIEERLSIDGEAIGPDLGREAFSVTTLAIAYAYTLGCTPIILAGVDLAYTGKQRYADGVVAQNAIDKGQLKKDKRSTDRLLHRKDRLGNPVDTMVKWVMESECIGAYAKAHPEREFLSATEGGIGFPGIEYTPLEEIAEQKMKQTHDLRGRIHSDIQNLKMTQISTPRIFALYEQLRLSLRRCLELCEEILYEIKSAQTPLPTTKMALLEHDLQSESAYEALMAVAVPALDHLLLRYMGRSEKDKVDQQRIKWHRVKEIIESQLQTLDSDGACS
ncbi:MAG: motility associated factor glycosyltransferase family protein [Chlamydiales bacterium]|nr:motility associated factor glycosyltransferase family protein [Chlamydiales bacterium]